MRYNIFNNIHKALRYLSYEAILTAQIYESAFSGNSDGAALHKVEEVLQFFEGYAGHGIVFIQPALARYNAGKAAALQVFNQSAIAAIQKLRADIAAFNALPTGDQKLRLAGNIHAAFLQLLTRQIEQMSFEEEELNPVLWQHYTDDEIRLLYRDIALSISPAELQVIIRLMMKALTNTEITEWAAWVKQQAPEATLGFLMELAERELPPVRWLAIQNILTEGVRCDV